jgi:hypothetical protein
MMGYGKLFGWVFCQVHFMPPNELQTARTFFKFLGCQRPEYFIYLLFDSSLKLARSAFKNSNYLLNYFFEHIGSKLKGFKFKFHVVFVSLSAMMCN